MLIFFFCWRAKSWNSLFYTTIYNLKSYYEFGFVFHFFVLISGDFIEHSLKFVCGFGNCDCNIDKPLHHAMSCLFVQQRVRDLIYWNVSVDRGSDIMHIVLGWKQNKIQKKFKWQMHRFRLLCGMHGQKTASTLISNNSNFQQQNFHFMNFNNHEKIQNKRKRLTFYFSWMNVCAIEIIDKRSIEVYSNRKYAAW